MAGHPSAYRTPYPTAPGGSSPPAETTPDEGKHELWAFFWLAIANTVIIAVAGIVTWLLVAH